MNKQTRGLYDSLEIRDQAILTQRPLKFMTDALLSQRQLKQVHPNSIDVNSDLRQTPTRLNEYNRLETSLYGTSACIASGLQNPLNEINTESNLLFGEPSRHFSEISRNSRILTEKQLYYPESLNIPLVDDSEFRGSSTRAMMRNNYRKFNSYKQRN